MTTKYQVEVSFTIDAENEEDAITKVRENLLIPGVDGPDILVSAQEA